MKSFIEALNNVATNIWGMIVLGLGIVALVACMAFKHEISPATMIIGGGLAIMQHKTQTP
jgi:hypothetical protein